MPPLFEVHDREAIVDERIEVGGGGAVMPDVTPAETPGWLGQTVHGGAGFDHYKRREGEGA